MTLAVLQRSETLMARPSRRGWRETAVLLLALLAFCWQSAVTQTHIHFHSDSLRSATAQGELRAAHHGKGSDPADCLLCKELAQSGHYLTPAPILLVIPAGLAFLAPDAAERLARRLTNSHSWRSRAPPTSSIG
jgi:hypothetical protein